MLVISLLLCLLGKSPDLLCTPGMVSQHSLHYICTTPVQRHVTVAMKRQVYLSYNLPYPNSETTAHYVIDHLIPLTLGGTNTSQNLWPMLKAQALLKDRQEMLLHAKVCKGEVLLQDAQEQMRQYGQ